MKQDLPSEFFNENIIVCGSSFSNWESLNDTIMGGRSQANCKLTSEGLELVGELIEEGGGFISCRSEEFKPPLNLSKYTGLNLEIEGDGRTLKLAVACQGGFFGINGWITEGLRWIRTFPTKDIGITRISIPFTTLIPTIQAKPITKSVKFDSSNINQFQLLYSKFGDYGEINSEFRSGSIRILLRSISGIL